MSATISAKERLKYGREITVESNEMNFWGQLKKADKNLKMEVLLFLSCIHKDSPKSIFDRLIKFIKNKELKEYRNHIPYAVGCLEIENQKKLFSEILLINIYLLYLSCRFYIMHSTRLYVHSTKCKTKII